MAETQTLKNHVRFFPLFHFVAIPILLINFIYQAWQVYQVPSAATGMGLLLAFGLMALGFAARVMALTVQDRIIRLEMRFRLQEVLPADLAARIHELTPKQLTALRFASDAELPPLVRSVLAGNLASVKAIKEQVKDWQGDYLRA